MNRSTNERKLANTELRERYGLRKWPFAKRCPKCGAMTVRRRKDGACFECVLVESKTRQLVGEGG